MKTTPRPPTTKAIGRPIINSTAREPNMKNVSWLMLTLASDSAKVNRKRSSP